MTRNLNTNISINPSDASDISNNSNIPIPRNKLTKEMKALFP